MRDEERTWIGHGRPAAAGGRASDHVSVWRFEVSGRGGDGGHVTERRWSLLAAWRGIRLPHVHSHRWYSPL